MSDIKLRMRRKGNELLANERLFLCGALELTQENDWFWTRRVADYINNLRLDDKYIGSGTILRVTQNLESSGLLETQKLAEHRSSRLMGRLTLEGIELASITFIQEFANRADSLDQFAESLQSPAGQLILFRIINVID